MTANPTTTNAIVPPSENLRAYRVSFYLAFALIIPLSLSWLPMILWGDSYFWSNFRFGTGAALLICFSTQVVLHCFGVKRIRSRLLLSAFLLPGQAIVITSASNIAGEYWEFGDTLIWCATLMIQALFVEAILRGFETKSVLLRSMWAPIICVIISPMLFLSFGWYYAEYLKFATITGSFIGAVAPFANPSYIGRDSME